MVDRASIYLGGIDIVCVDELQYLGSSIHHCGCPSDGVDARVAAVSSACGTLQKPVFSVRYLDIHIERCVFHACTLSLLVYGSECWTPLQCDIRHLSSFHIRCICSVLGITRAQAWVERISDAELFVLWDDVGTIKGKLGHHRLEWFGLLPEWRIAGYLGTFFPQRYSAYRLRNRWKYGVVRDLRSCDLLASWYDVVRETGSAWRNTHSSVAYNQPHVQPDQCIVCHQVFSSP